MFKQKLIRFIFVFSLIFIAGPGISYINANAQIIIDPVSKTISITGITLGSGEENQTGNITDNLENKVDHSLNKPAPTTGTEFERALWRMYANWLTKYDNEKEYRKDDPLTREESAKMFARAYEVLWYPQEVRNHSCDFSDKKIFNPELTPFIQTVCQLGIIKWFNGEYMAQKSLTRPEALAILIRMFEGQASFEDQHPRWSDYYLKWKAIWLTSLSDNWFEQAISRYEVALYIFRLQTIVSDQNLKYQSQQTIQNLTWITQTWTIIEQSESSSELSQKLSAIANSISVDKDPELQEAIRWMYDNKLSNFSTIESYKPFEVLSREQAAKIFDVFAKLFDFSQEKLSASLPNECNFKDISKAEESLKWHIQNVCQMDILKWWNQMFDPKTNLTKWQFITALIRLVEGKKLNENLDPRWTSYYQKALDIWVVWPADAITFDSPITRYEVALFLYRFKVKFQLVNSLNNNTIDNMIVSTVAGSIQTEVLSWDISSNKSANVFVDTNLLQNSSFDIWYIEIFETKYRIIKTSIDTFFSKNIVRYWDIYDINNDEKIWTINFVVSNKTILEATIRIWSQNYKISQVPSTTSYYQIDKN